MFKSFSRKNIWKYFFILSSCGPEGRSEQAIILDLCGSGKYTAVLCFSIRGGDARVPAPSRTWGVERFLERSLMCLVVTGLGCLFHFGTNEIK